MDTEEYLDKVIDSNAKAIQTISEDGRNRLAKLLAFKGLIRHAVVRAQQIERGEIKPPFDGTKD